MNILFLLFLIYCRRQQTKSNKANQQTPDVEPTLGRNNGVQSENDGVTQYEDIKGVVIIERSQNTYEGLSDEVRHILTAIA